MRCVVFTAFREVLVFQGCATPSKAKFVIGDRIAPIVEDKGNLIVPTIVLYEVFKKTIAMKGLDYAKGFLPAMLGGHVIPLNIGLSVRAVHISRDHKLPTADSIIYATAMQHNAILWTTDQHFDGLPNVQYFDKTHEG
jgi:predicted nucleic acid-binding protein